MNRIRTRFAPSPTGPLHMGGVRTALYSFLFAKKHGGDFLLRIEDTDQNRFVPGAEDYIIESLKWCGIIVDEGISAEGKFAPYRQSERKEIYRKFADQLVNSGHAYYAFDTSAELETIRRQAEASGKSFAYDASTRMQMQNSLSLPANEWKHKQNAGEACVIRLKVPQNESIHLNDLVRGRVSFHSNQVDDKVLLKADGMPTYHLAHIVDDVLMEITHAIRGEEWLPSSPAHVLIYKFLGWEDRMPHYAHLPLLLKPDGKGKLSKRDGDKGGFPVFPLEWTDPVTGEKSQGYREQGYYPEAFVNMLALLGWNPGTEQEIFSMHELIEKFSFEHVHKAGARFDPLKAIWFNEQWLQRMPDERLKQNLKSALQKEFNFKDGDEKLKDSFLEGCIRLLKPRIQFENEMTGKGKYLFVAPDGYDEQVVLKKWKPEHYNFFSGFLELLSALSPFTSENMDNSLKKAASQQGVKTGDALQLFRLLLSGQGTGVDLFPMAELLGKPEVCSRIQRGIAVLNNRLK